MIAYNYCMKEAKEEIIWDKKKIILFLLSLLVALVLLYEFKNLVFGANSVQNNPLSSGKKQSVAGASSTIVPEGVSLKNNVQQQIDNLKNEASNINVVDIATSSPQVQKVINDLKALQDYPSNQLKQTCINICNRL